MNWRDYFYFSKGERIALTVLTGLITAAWTTLLLADPWQQTSEPTVSPQPSSTPPQQDTLVAIKPDSTVKPAAPSIAAQEQRPSRRKQLFQSRYPRQQKYPEGTVVELNRADTTELKKVPGIGSAFSRRIVKFRNLLGGFYTVGQLQEVYGIDPERYESLKRWFKADTTQICKLKVNECSVKELSAHPYISYQQAKTIKRLVRQKQKLTGWEQLQLLEEFTEADRIRILPYLSFE